MKIKSIKKVGHRPVYDICVKDQHNYVLENGVVTHNSGLVYGCNDILLITKSQEKKGTDIVGYNFNINVMKSRSSREKSRIPVTVLYQGGVNVFSGLMDMAVASGDVIKPSNGWYQAVDPETGEILGNKMRLADTNTHEFWDPILARPHFKKWVKDTFSITSRKLMSDTIPTEQDQPDQEFTADID